MTEHDPSQSNRQQALREDVRFRILHALDGDAGLSQRGVSQATGASLGAVNALLNNLIETALVEIGTSETAPAQFRFAYGLTAAGRAEARRLAGRYLQRRRAELEALRREIDALEAEFGPGKDPRG